MRRDRCNAAFMKNGRHEMFHEVNKDEVFQDLISWLDKHIV